MSIIRAQISQTILSKADRLFRNDDAGVFVELLQNARRAGATVVEVRIEASEAKPATESKVTFHDNGRGVDDFQKLLTLGDSDWSAEVRAEEDPAGMGFYSLCHSTVAVWSGDRRVVLSREVFLGVAEAEVESTEGTVAGTQIVFTRPSAQQALLQAIASVSEFGPLDVLVNGEAVERHDFLEGALHREVIDGVEVGFGTSFRNRFGWRDDNWNFHGSVIRHDIEAVPGLLNRDRFEHWTVETLQTRFNVLEVGRVKLQLPDRRAVVQNEQLTAFAQKVRAAAYRFIGTLERHVLSFKHWEEARMLGVDLAEASPLLKTWHANTLDDGIDPFFGQVEVHLLSSTKGTLLIAEDLPSQHTLEAALLGGDALDRRLYQSDRSYEGYRWYDALPVLADTTVTVDGTPFDEWPADDPRPETITVNLTIRQTNEPDKVVSVPALIHVVDGYEASMGSEGPEFVAIRNSPWDNEMLDGPFDVVQFLVDATFCSSDDAEADSYDTQRDYYEAQVQREADGYFRGPRAALLGILRESLSWEARQYARQVGVREIRFKREGEDSTRWTVEILPSEDASETSTAR